MSGRFNFSNDTESKLTAGIAGGWKAQQWRKGAMAKTKRWVRKVKTVSTAPPKDLFTKDAQTIARTMAKKDVSPKGTGSGIRMLQYFINRGGKNLSAATEARVGESKSDSTKEEKSPVD